MTPHWTVFYLALSSIAFQISNVYQVFTLVIFLQVVFIIKFILFLLFSAFSSLLCCHAIWVWNINYAAQFLLDGEAKIMAKVSGKAVITAERAYKDNGGFLLREL